MRQTNISYQDQLAGVLTEYDVGYEFRYLLEYSCKDCIRAASVVSVGG